MAILLQNNAYKKRKKKRKKRYATLFASHSLIFTILDDRTNRIQSVFSWFKSFWFPMRLEQVIIKTEKHLFFVCFFVYIHNKKSIFLFTSRKTLLAKPLTTNKINCYLSIQYGDGIAAEIENRWRKWSGCICEHWSSLRAKKE